MAIEFRCSQCQRLLRTGDDTAGKQAQCPECGAITTIPAAPDAIREPAIPASSTPSQPDSSPTGQRNLPQQSPVLPQPSGPWPQNGGGVLVSPAFAAERLSTPATAIILLTILGIAFQGYFLLRLTRVGTEDFRQQVIAQNPELKDLPLDSFNQIVKIIVVATIIQLLFDAVILAGAIQMRRVRNRGFAVFSAILALIPCTSPCCVFTLPFAIWALVVLNDETVKAAFR
jgi:phage FluMu protein Com